LTEEARPERARPPTGRSEGREEFLRLRLEARPAQARSERGELLLGGGGVRRLLLFNGRERLLGGCDHVGLGGLQPLLQRVRPLLGLRVELREAVEGRGEVALLGLRVAICVAHEREVLARDALPVLLRHGLLDLDDRVLHRPGALAAVPVLDLLERPRVETAVYGILPV